MLIGPACRCVVPPVPNLPPEQQPQQRNAAIEGFTTLLVESPPKAITVLLSKTSRYAAVSRFDMARTRSRSACLDASCEAEVNASYDLPHLCPEL